MVLCRMLIYLFSGVLMCLKICWINAFVLVCFRLVFGVLCEYRVDRFSRFLGVIVLVLRGRGGGGLYFVKWYLVIILVIFD